MKINATTPVLQMLHSNIIHCDCDMNRQSCPKAEF